MSNLLQKQCYTVSEKVSLLSLAAATFYKGFLGICLLDTGKGNWGLQFFFKVGCIAADIHKTSFLSSPCLDHMRRGKIIYNFLLRCAKRAMGKSTDPPTPKIRSYTWILGMILNQRKIHALLCPQPICIYIPLIWFSIPCILLKPGRQGSTGKGTFPTCYLKRCWCFALFSQVSSNPSFPTDRAHMQWNYLWDKPATSIFT